MQRKNQQMAIVIDEYGLMAGVVTVEDLIEEIVGDLGEEDRRPAPDVVRESGGSMVIRGSVPIDKVGRAFRRATRRILLNNREPPRSPASSTPPPATFRARAK